MRLLQRLTSIFAAIFGTCVVAQEELITNPSVQVVGYDAEIFVDRVREHNLVSEDIPVFGPNEEADANVIFVLVAGWDSIANIPGAAEVCNDICVPGDEVIHVASVTKVANEQVRKYVFLDLNSVAPKGGIAESIGFSGCVAEQLENDAIAIDAESSPCLRRLAGGTFTSRRNVSRR